MLSVQQQQQQQQQQQLRQQQPDEPPSATPSMQRQRCELMAAYLLLILIDHTLSSLSSLASMVAATALAPAGNGTGAFIRLQPLNP